MSKRGTYRFCGQTALFVAVVAFVLQPACSALFASLQADSLTPVDPGCHDSGPATPPQPHPHEQCCSGNHYPEVLLKTVEVAPAPLTYPQVETPLLLHLSSPALVRPFSDSSPPGALVLRI